MEIPTAITGEADTVTFVKPDSLRSSPGARAPGLPPAYRLRRIEEIAVEYKVWIHIEEHEEGTDDYKDTGFPELVTELDTLEEADAFMMALVRFGKTYLAEHPYY